MLFAHFDEVSILCMLNNVVTSPISRCDCSFRIELSEYIKYWTSN